MSTQYLEYPTVPLARGFSWTGIFAGTFLFLAIEATFGALAIAIFGVQHPLVQTPGMPQVQAGMGIWMVILSIIALYFAGKLASRLSGSVDRNVGMYAGLVTFGMSIVATILVMAVALGSPIGGTGVGFVGATRVTNFVVAGGWYVFAALVLSMISAGFGGIHGSLSPKRRQPPLERPAEPRKVA